LLLHCHLSPPHEVSDNPGRAALCRALDPKLSSAWYLTAPDGSRSKGSLIIYLLISRVFILFVVYLTMLSQWLNVASNELVLSEWWVGKDLEGSGRGLILRYYHGIRLEQLRKTMKQLSQDSRTPGRIWTRDPGIRSRSVNRSTMTLCHMYCLVTTF
jgi:hypothetical protein